MKKSYVILLLLALLIACGQPEVSGRKMSSPTGAVAGVPDMDVQDEYVPEPEDVQPVENPVAEKTAKEALEEVKAVETLNQPVAKQGATLYPPIVSSKTGKDALMERTHEAFSQSNYQSDIDADKTFGPKYHDDDGDPENLPDEYGSGRDD